MLQEAGGEQGDVLMILVPIAVAFAASEVSVSFQSDIPSSAEELLLPASEGLAPREECLRNACIISYEAIFFERYNPITALDMLRNLPGFQIDDGDDARGFGGSAGNVLINGERVAAKSETPSDVLARTPVASVERIELIRGQTGGLDLRGQSVVANVILSSDAGGAAAWQLRSIVNLKSPGAFPFGRLSYSDRAGPLSYTVGGEVERTQFRFDAEERVLDGAGALGELRREIFEETGFRSEASINAELSLGRTALRVNGSFGYFDESGEEESERIPLSGDPVLFVLEGSGFEELSAEIGGDVERSFADDFTAKLIGLYRRDDATDRGSLARGPSAVDAALGSVTSSETLDTEAIVRLELDYSGLPGHLIELSAEGAVNKLDSVFSLFEDEGAGLVPVDVPGAVTQVRETRGDFSISDSWSVGAVGFDGVVAAETSRIEQTGGFAAERSFFFMKPSLTATYAPNQQTQIRLRGLREIGQLDFFDFVSSTDLGDVELQLGNPDLAPETTWTFDASLERRFGEISVVTVTAFHDWISDVEDVVPVAGGLEVPGNIGEGVRRGVSGEGVAPLDALGVAGGRLDFSGRYQFSRVTDPVTGETRRLSDERAWQAAVEFRQDLSAAQVSWGWDIAFRGARRFFGLDEDNRSQDRPDLDAFVETTRFAGLRMRFGMENLLNQGADRDRLVFDGSRDLAMVDFREVRERNNGREVLFSVSGNF